MNDYHNQPNFRDWFSYCIDICSQGMPKQTESMFRAMSANTYHSDFVTLMSILNNQSAIYLINKEILKNAAEYYKQANKALLVFRCLTDIEKSRESTEIDFEASRLIDEWSRQLHNKNIRIV